MSQIRKIESVKTSADAGTPNNRCVLDMVLKELKLLLSKTKESAFNECGEWKMTNLGPRAHLLVWV